MLLNTLWFCVWVSGNHFCIPEDTSHVLSYFLPQYPGWTLTSAGSLLMATVNDDASGVYACTPYNSYGTAGASGPTDVILKVGARSQPSQGESWTSRGSLYHFKKSCSGHWKCGAVCVCTRCACVLIRHLRICRGLLETQQKWHFSDLFTSTRKPPGVNASQLKLTATAPLLGS